MRRKIPKSTIFVLLLISLVLGGIIRFALTSSAATLVHLSFYTGGEYGVTINAPGCYSTAQFNAGTRDCHLAYSSSSTITATVSMNQPTYCSTSNFKGWKLKATGKIVTTSRSVTVHRTADQTYIATFSGCTQPAAAPPPVVAPPVDTPDPAPVVDNTPEPAASASGGYDVASETIVTNNEPEITTTDTSAQEPADTQAPTVPANVQASFDSSSNTINLTWDDSNDNNSVSGYEIQRAEKGSSSWTSVGNVASASFTDFTFAPSKTYDYQVRAYDDTKNFSAWSASAEVVAGEFKANVTQAEGGTVISSDNVAIVEVPEDAVNQDLVIIINKVNLKGLTLPSNMKQVGSYYDIKAKDSQGNEVTKFKRQISIRFNYTKVNLFGAQKSTLKISTSDGKKVTVLPTSLDNTTATTLTDHFSYYFLAAQKTGFWGTLAWIMLWLLLIAGIGAAGYFGWKKYMLYRYQQEHKEDFIYKH